MLSWTEVHNRAELLGVTDTSSDRADAGGETQRVSGVGEYAP